MITVQEAEQILADFQYQPNWQFTLIPYRESAFDRLAIEIRAIFPDTYGLKDTIEAKWGKAVPDDTTSDTFLDVMWDAISELESHERAEWFVYKGNRVRDPHGPGLGVTMQKENPNNVKENRPDGMVPDQWYPQDEKVNTTNPENKGNTGK